ncbi:MAG: D-glycero-beta-D-manno-heptose 1-phosphate adenylyltransferase [Bacteroidetes bacterium]|nr:D-glycero-beta-D-manno-heptose 1-phosphate adenylyltransferase [Bacteroidota bacterium]
MQPLVKYNLQIIADKIYNPNDLVRAIAAWRLKDKKIVFTNGCFDLLHLGHIDYLSKAADLGDVLIVGVNSDDSVRRLQKAPSRPIQDEKSRSTIIAALHFVTAVVVFNEDTPYELIKHIQPDVLVKGADYTLDKVVGRDIVETRGGRVELINYLEGYSTTRIENKIKLTN